METQLPRLELPSGADAWVEFGDLDDLTGHDLHELRKQIRAEDSAGETTNALYRKAIELLVRTWSVPYLADPRTPQANPAAWKRLKLRDLRALERHVEPVLALMREGDNAVTPPDDDTPGGPTPPDSE
jgi:hypothetical protein